MSVNRSFLAILCGSLLLGCGGGGASNPQPVVTEEPRPASEQPRVASQEPEPASEAPKIGVQEPLPNAQDPLPPSSGAAGASPDDS